MKKIIYIILICLIVIGLGNMARYFYIKKLGNNHMKCINEELKTYEKSIEGMKVTMLGGSNMEDKGNINSMGFCIRTKDNELIFIDGGRDIDSELVEFFAMKYGNGKVDHWIITHAHSDHVGALTKLLSEENNIEIENLYYSFLSEEWYKEHDKRGYDSEHQMLECLSSDKIKNTIECQEGQIIEFDNIKCDIIRTANPEITNSDNGNEASMVFKLTATDVNKSMIFLGDAFVYTSKELLEAPEKLKADAVQMAHHGQNGVTKEVYEAIDPDICFFNCPKWLYENDNGGGYNSGTWQSITVRQWMQEIGAKNYVAYEGDQTIRFTSEGFFEIEE